MRVSRVVYFAVLVVVAAMLQVTAIARLPLPGGPPELLVVIVVACALIAGPIGGMVVGFLAGLLADLIPPADHTVGVLALVFCLVGYATGHLEDLEERSVLAPVFVVIVATAGAVLGDTLLSALLGDLRAQWTTVARDLPTSLLYDGILTPFVVPVVAAMARRLEPDVNR